MLNRLKDVFASFERHSKADLVASKKAAGRPVDLEDVRLLELPDQPTGS
jgi:hypothetical protein